jgi:hypothetical protein
MLLDSRREDKVSGVNGSKHYQIQSALNFLLNQTLIYYCCSNIFEVCHILKGSVACLYVLTLPCVLVTRQHILSFHCVYF